MSILDQIVETKRREVAALAASDIQALERAARLAPPTRGFLAQLKRPGMQVIAEIKKPRHLRAFFVIRSIRLP